MQFTEMNNHAAELINHERYAQAYFILRNAMEEQEMRCRSADERARNEPHKTGRRRMETVELDAIAPLAEDSMFSSPLVICRASWNGEYVDTTRCVQHTTCATAVFNMGLACHLYMQQHVSTPHLQRRFSRMAQALYQQALEIGSSLPISLLHLALCNNLIEVSFEQDDWEGINMWNSIFSQLTQTRPMGVSDDVWMHFMKARMYYSEDSSTAGAA